MSKGNGNSVEEAKSEAVGEAEIMTREQRLTELDRVAHAISDKYLTDMVSQEFVGSFSEMQRMGEAIKTLHNLLDDPGIEASIMWLQGHTLGFKTDKDADGDKYPWQVVKPVLIDACMRGLRVCGNMFNVISAQLYITKNGYRYTLNRLPGLESWIIEVLPFKMTGEREATGTCVAPYIFNGAHKKLERSFQVVANRGMGPDAIRAKLKRKMMAEMLDVLTNGRMQPQDGEIEDLDFAGSRIVNKETPKIESGRQPKGPDTFNGKGPNATLFDVDADGDACESYRKLMAEAKRIPKLVVKALRHEGYKILEDLNKEDERQCGAVYAVLVDIARNEDKK